MLSFNFIVYCDIFGKTLFEPSLVQMYQFIKTYYFDKAGEGTDDDVHLQNICFLKSFKTSCAYYHIIFLNFHFSVME